MSSSDRSKQRRALGFEHLESKTSPTAALADAVWVEAPSAAEVAVLQQQPSGRFLEYVAAMLVDTRIEREIPTQADAAFADRMLASETPDPTN